jgi:hypothetical protein
MQKRGPKKPKLCAKRSVQKYSPRFRRLDLERTSHSSNTRMCTSRVIQLIKNDTMLIKLKTPSKQPFKEFFTVSHTEWLLIFFIHSFEFCRLWCEDLFSCHFTVNSINSLLRLLRMTSQYKRLGLVSDTSYNGSPSEDLFKVDMNIISYGTCTNMYWNGLYNKVMLYNGGIGKDTSCCQEDSGGEYTHITLPALTNILIDVLARWGPHDEGMH